MINKCVCQIAVLALATLAASTAAHAQFSSVAYPSHGFGAGILAGVHGALAQLTVQTNDDLARGSFDSMASGAKQTGFTFAAGPASLSPGNGDSLLVRHQANVTECAHKVDPVSGPTYASLGVIGAALVCGWCWKKPERRTPRKPAN